MSAIAIVGVTALADPPAGATTGVVVVVVRATGCDAGGADAGWPHAIKKTLAETIVRTAREPRPNLRRCESLPRRLSRERLAPTRARSARRAAKITRAETAVVYGPRHVIAWADRSPHRARRLRQRQQQRSALDRSGLQSARRLALHGAVAILGVRGRGLDHADRPQARDPDDDAADEHIGGGDRSDTVERGRWLLARRTDGDGVSRWRIGRWPAGQRQLRWQPRLRQRDGRARHDDQHARRALRRDRHAGDGHARFAGLVHPARGAARWRPSLRGRDHEEGQGG